MKKLFLSIWALIMLFNSVSICGVMTAEAASGTAANKYNVVFVLDASGSMKQTDPSGLRYDAMNLFLGLLTETGNCVGDVIFTEEVSKKHDIKEIKSVDDKKEVFNHLQEITPTNGDTNIGLAIAAATDMLDSQKNNNLDSVIILLSDGNTDLKTQKALEEANYYKEYGIGHARSGKYGIYCIGLNVNGGMNGDELKGIAENTNGKFIEVSNPSDLSKVTETFYSMIYQTPSEMEKLVIGADGRIQKDFTVPDIGIEEVNVVVRGKIDSMEFVRPDNSKISADEAEKMSMKSNEFVNTKIVSPQKGPWSVMIYGNPGAEVTISMISNVDLAIRAEAENPQNVYKRGDTVKVNATIVSKGADVSDPGIYDANKAVLKLRNNASGQETSYDMRNEMGKYVAEVTLDELCTYEGVVELTADKIKKSSDKLVFNVDNTPPALTKGDIVEDKIVLWPFSHSGKTYNLSEYFQDDADKVLQYRSKDVSFKDGDTSIDNGILSVYPSVGVDGTMTVVAEDSRGATAELQFKIKVVSVTKIAIIIVCVIALIVLGILAFFIIKQARLRYRGKLLIQVFDKSTGVTYNRQIHEPFRGKQPITSLDMAASEVGLSGTFRPKNATYIVYESKRPFFCSNSQDRSTPVKSVDIALGMSIVLSDNEDFMSGANITYM